MAQSVNDFDDEAGRKLMMNDVKDNIRDLG